MVSDARRRLLLAGVLLAMSCPAVFAQKTSRPAAQPAAAKKAQSSVAPRPRVSSGSAAATVASVSPAQLIDFLNQTIGWYHKVTIQQGIATAPDEQLTLYDNRQIAKQVVQLAFQFASAQADAILEQVAANRAATPGASASQYQTLRQMQAKLDKDYQDTQAELDGDKTKLATTTGAKRRTLEATVSELQGEIALIQARRDAVDSMAQFMSSSAANAAGSAGLRAQIDALKASVPDAISNVSQTSTGQRSIAAAPPSTANGTDISGIWSLAADLFSLSSKKSTINSLIDDTDALSNSSKQLRGPFVTHLRALSAEGDQLAAQADTANQSMLQQERDRLDSLAAQFRQISAAVIPLSKQTVLLNLFQNSLTNWRDVVQERYKSDLKNLGVRLGFLAVIFAILFGLAELWRRAVVRYVQEPRRRHQFLLLRKFVLWFVIALILAIMLAGKLGSIATFAGLLTAGVALALQNVIVSTVGYFFLIGKYGIRVGDRVQVAGTTGEVVDVGLVRFHMMELDTGGTPTGRVVAFSNSIVFQPAAGLFKQIPGTSFTWHEASASVSRQADFTQVRKKLLEAAESVLKDYRDDIARQYRVMEKTGMLVSEKGLRPRVNLRLSSAAVEVDVRYPVDLQHAAEIDARMSRELVLVLEEESESSGPAPTVRVKADVPASGSS